MRINELIEKAHENAVKHGFWDFYDHIKATHAETKQAIISQDLMLIVSEVAEAQDGLRHGDMDNFREELADVAIRLADLCGGLGVDLETEIKKKIAKNKDRPYKHGKQF
ncbi:nucleotide pyrophosphohydrolase [Clostridium felsineum]|uniref:MazG-like family protein n=1 Tax=Clostridium felsineum TaxID=36839 RepID=UPI00214DA82A|nr:MazG-like family protein [Clostridium felsineum]MCR3760391.1 nucleotide pyrophosphohydrolase [Clostridium felsineum]